MPDFNSLLTGLTAKWKALEKNQKLRIILSAIVILGSAIVAIAFVANPNYTKLITGTVSEIGEMSKVLTEGGINHKITDNSTAIMVAEKSKDAAEIALSQSGLLKDGMKLEDSLKSISFTSTQSDKDKIYKEYYEGKIAEKLMKMDSIRYAVVTFTSPEKSVFLTTSEEDEPTASVLITPTGALSAGQVQGIVKLVASSVERLSEKNVTVVDSTGNVLSETDDFKMTGISTKQLEVQSQKKKEIEKQVGQLLAAVTDSVIVMANVICDFDQETTATVKYTTPIEDSDTGLLRSQGSLKENLQNMDYGAVPGTDSNQGTGAQVTSTGNGGTYTKSEITNNYELNEESKEIVKGLGNIDPIKSSITVNLLYGKEFTEAPSDENIESITKMISTATGIDMTRVTVASFKTTPKVEESIKLPINWSEIIQRYAPYLAAIIIILILVVFILRLKDGMTEVDYGAIATPDTGAFFNATVGRDDDLGGQIKELDNNSEVKQQINKFIEKQPDIAAGMLRNWIYENEKNNV